MATTFSRSGVIGGAVQRNHNGICATISASLSEANIPHRGGLSDRTCKGLFRSAVPPSANAEDGERAANKIIPDLVILTGHYTTTHPVAGADDPKALAKFRHPEGYRYDRSLTETTPAGTVVSMVRPAR